MRRIQWTSDDAHACVLQIEDGSNTTTDMVGGASPFVTEMDDDEDIFCKVRTQSGNIRVVVDSVADLADLVGHYPSERMVTFYRDNAVVWKGFLRCETFTQAWDAGPLEISLPVMSCLEWLNEKRPSAAVSSMILIPIAALIKNMSAAVGNVWTAFVFPELTEPEACLYYKVDMANWLTVSSDTETRTMASYMTILEDLCGLFGWTCVEIGQKLCFLACDKVALAMNSGGDTFAYKEYSAADMTAIANGQTVTGTPRLWSEVVATIAGNDHSLEYLGAKNSVAVTGKKNVQDEKLWGLNVLGNCDFYDRQSKHIGTIINRYYYTQNYMSSGGITIWNNLTGVGNIKYANTDSEANDAYMGGSIVYERNFIFDYSQSAATVGDKDYVQRLIMRAKSNNTAYKCASIKTGYRWHPQYNDNHNVYIMLKGAFEVATSATNYFGDYSGNIYISVKIGDYYYNLNTRSWSSTANICGMVVQNGKFVENRAWVDAPFDTTDCYAIKAPNTSGLDGELVIEFWVPAPNDSAGNYGTDYIAVKEFEVRIVKSYIDGTKNDGDHVSRVELEHGATDSWSEESGLTTFRDDDYDTRLMKSYVLDSIGDVVAVLYGDGFPEDELSARAGRYYGVSRKLVIADVQADAGLLDMTKQYDLGDTANKYLLGYQSVDWRRDVVRGGFFELVVD